MIDDPWAICVSSARKLGMWQEEAGHRAARVDGDGLEVRHANDDDDDDGEGAARPHMVEQAHFIFVHVLTLSPQTLDFFFLCIRCCLNIVLYRVGSIIYVRALEAQKCLLYPPTRPMGMGLAWVQLYPHPYPNIPMDQTRAGIETRANHYLRKGGTSAINEYCAFTRNMY